jgi:hypothetical protein
MSLKLVTQITNNDIANATSQAGAIGSTSSTYILTGTATLSGQTISGGPTTYKIPIVLNGSQITVPDSIITNISVVGSGTQSVAGLTITNLSLSVSSNTISTISTSGVSNEVFMTGNATVTALTGLTTQLTTDNQIRPSGSNSVYGVLSITITNAGADITVGTYSFNVSIVYNK